MTDPTRGTDRGGRRAKKFLTPLQKYEVFLQLVRQEVTMMEAAEHWQVDRGVIMRIRTVAKEGALEALSNSRPGRRAKERDFELEAARADAARLGEALKEMAVKLMRRRAVGELEDRVPGGNPMHGLLDDEVAAIIALYHDWGEVDRSHRKLAHRGSYTERVWVAPSSVRRVLAAQGLHLNPRPAPGPRLPSPSPSGWSTAPTTFGFTTPRTSPGQGWPSPSSRTW